jgi:hypothetical protein
VFGTTAWLRWWRRSRVDRTLFATERVMAALYALCAMFLLLATQVTSFVAVFMVLLAVCLCYFPTIALTNAITMQQVADPGRDFPPIRMLGTIGWIVINLVVGFMRVEATATPFVLGAAVLVMCVYSLVRCRTCRRARGQKATVRALGLTRRDAQDPSYWCS